MFSYKYANGVFLTFIVRQKLHKYIQYYYKLNLNNPIHYITNQE